MGFFRRGALTTKRTKKFFTKDTEKNFCPLCCFLLFVLFVVNPHFWEAKSFTFNALK